MGRNHVEDVRGRSFEQHLEGGVRTVLGELRELHACGCARCEDPEAGFVRRAKGGLKIWPLVTFVIVTR